MKIGVFAVNGSTNADIPVTIEDFTCNDTPVPFGQEVRGDSLNQVTLLAPRFLPQNGTGTVSVQGELMNGQAADLSEANIVYKSDTEDVVRVDADGALTAVSSGTAKITVEVTLGDITKEAFAYVMVDGEGDQIWTLSSPDGKIQPVFFLNEEGTVEYAVQTSGKTVVESGILGLNTSVGNFKEGLVFVSQSDVTSVTDEYDLIGAKVSHVKAVGNEMTLNFIKDGIAFNVVARAYDDGMAFRYEIGGQKDAELSIHSEETTFGVPAGSTVYAMNYYASHQEEVKKYTDLMELTGEYLVPGSLSDS